MVILLSLESLVCWKLWEDIAFQKWILTATLASHSFSCLMNYGDPTTTHTAEIRARREK